MDTEITVGKKFAQFDDLQDAIHKYEKIHCIQLKMRDCKHLQSGYIRKTKPHRVAMANPDLIYYYINFTCNKGGRKFVSTSTGKRKSSTINEGCPVKIKFVLSKDGQSLEVAEMIEDHNHEVNNFDRSKHYRKCKRTGRMVATKFISAEEKYLNQFAGESESAANIKIQEPLEGFELKTEHDEDEFSAVEESPVEDNSSEDRYSLAVEACNDLANIICQLDSDRFDDALSMVRSLSRLLGSYKDQSHFEMEDDMRGGEEMDPLLYNQNLSLS